jgi:hypothetical protein
MLSSNDNNVKDVEKRRKAAIARVGESDHDLQ